MVAILLSTQTPHVSEFMCGSRKVDKATWKRESKLPWREAGPRIHLGEKVDPGQYVINKELSLWPFTRWRTRVSGPQFWGGA